MGTEKHVPLDDCPVFNNNMENQKCGGTGGGGPGVISVG
jgi:hypothetical protein